MPGVFQISGVRLTAQGKKVAIFLGVPSLKKSTDTFNVKAIISTNIVVLDSVCLWYGVPQIDLNMKLVAAKALQYTTFINSA